uniref:EF-hand domain-containing protein n=1 Tax=Odontella aurita TaxID=265563 RepID=A0A7S4JGK8_9STRA|mmetsp:Transcript_4619/g.12981  ORF Transcript_4619/g.12981 Transcript_4619/m.12981 type:complete len:586 (+) Transcript_4619:163-1920(+)
MFATRTPFGLRTGQHLCASRASNRLLSIRFYQHRPQQLFHLERLISSTAIPDPILIAQERGESKKEVGVGKLKLYPNVPAGAHSVQVKEHGNCASSSIAQEGGKSEEEVGVGKLNLYPHVPAGTGSVQVKEQGNCASSPIAQEGGNSKDEVGVGGLKLYPNVPAGARSVQIKGNCASPSRFWQFLRSNTVDVNFDYRSWAKHSGPWRNAKMFLPKVLWGSSDLRRILFPDVAMTGVVAASLSYYNSLCAAEILQALDTDGDGDVSVAELKAGIDAGLVQAHHIMGTDFFTSGDMLMLNTTIPFTLTSMALGMMLTFRTQNCNKRYNEARLIWGSMVNESRALSSRIMALVGTHPKDSEVGKAGVHLVKCIMTFSHALKYHVTTNGHCPGLNIHIKMTDAEVREVKGVALRQELFERVWDHNDPTERAFVDRLIAPGVASQPLHALQEISEINVQVFMKPKADGGAGLEPHHSDAIFRSVTRLQDVLGACERIHKTPIYTGATRFTSRCVWLWTNLIPFALFPIMGPIATVPGSVVVAIFMYGLEDVGARIEDPFASLPLWQYCDGIDSGCMQTIAQHEVLKKIPR